MKIAVYTLCYNEEFLLPYFFRHYQQFTDDITVYDNQSTDHSVELIQQYGGRIKTFESNNQIRDDILLTIKNSCWKEKKDTDTDWVFIVDVDEFIYHPNLLAFLETTKKEKVTILVPQGYTMISESLPKGNGQIYEEVDHGISDDSYSKAAIFDPDNIEEMNYSPGCHCINPVGNVVIMSDPELKLLHFTYLSLEWHLAKYRTRAARLSQSNIKRFWGNQYLKQETRLKSDFEKTLKKAQKVV